MAKAKPMGDPLVRSIEEARVLIVDDERTNVRVLEAHIKKDGFQQVRGLTDAREVIPFFKEFRPDIVLLDLIMPRLDGFEIMALLKPLIPEGEFLPILVLTASHSRETKHRALASGASDFLTKPFDSVEVSLRLRNLVRIRVQQQTVQIQQRLLEDQNRLLEDKVTQRTKALQISQEEVVWRLAQANEFRDDNSGGHIRRVAYLTGAVAAQLGLPDEHVPIVSQAATLHDVGKIGISDGILLKPARLTEAEYSAMQSHTLMGAKLLANGQSQVIQLAQTIAVTHHERWDGTGYPHRLKGEDIPLEGRIVAVVDVLDALTHERPYKAAWPMDEALAEIQRLSGSHFDPEVVDALVRLPPSVLRCEQIDEPQEL
jgi:putative two-component system response regulator